MSAKTKQNGRWAAALAIASIAAIGGGVAHGAYVAHLLGSGPLFGATEARTAEAGQLVLRDLPPLLTNLSMPADMWVRVEVGLLYDPRELPEPTAAVAEVTSDLLAFLRALTFRDLQGPDGLSFLRQEFKERVRLRTAGRVRDIVIQGLVVQ